MRFKHSVKKYLFMVSIALLFLWFASDVGFSPALLVEGLPFMADFVKRMFPPDLTDLPKFLGSAWQTIQMAFVGTVLGASFALPLGFLAARNINPSRVTRQIVRSIMDVFRGISEIIWALIFVAMVGLGAFPGVLALTTHLTGALGRFFSEAIEGVRPNIVEAVRSTGANNLQVIAHAIIPEIKPLFTNYIFYYFEHNIRAATVLGLVGAGGIGVELVTRVRLFRYGEVLTLLIIIVLMVILFDRVSAYVRKKFVLSRL